MPELEGDIVWITNYEFDKYFIIDAWVKSGGSCDVKVKERYKKKKKENDIDE